MAIAKPQDLFNLKVAMQIRMGKPLASHEKNWAKANGLERKEEERIQNKVRAHAASQRREHFESIQDRRDRVEREGTELIQHMVKA